MGDDYRPKHVELIEIVNKIIIVASKRRNVAKPCYTKRHERDVYQKIAYWFSYFARSEARNKTPIFFIVYGFQPP